ncbi:hypothetical protein M8818_004625 [Zalaria obscura]|uniref:Uncharacterized protein n=1 Tax=Zalaria obscura TaxID=2024903 RepID=A0ACC3SCG6_9PEZI
MGSTANPLGVVIAAMSPTAARHMTDRRARLRRGANPVSGSSLSHDRPALLLRLSPRPKSSPSTAFAE